MKGIAISLNLLLIVTLVYLIVTKGPPGKSEFFIFAVAFAAPISALLALLLEGSESWLGLYFKRKALEEKKKIKNLGEPE